MRRVKTPIKLLALCLAAEMDACSLDELTNIGKIILNAVRHDELREKIVLAMADAGIKLPEDAHGKLQGELVTLRDEQRAKLQKSLEDRKAAELEAAASPPQASAPAKDDAAAPTTGRSLVAVRNGGKV